MKKILFAFLMALMSFKALAQPAQYPLLSRDGGTAKPNIVLTMDDSYSMYQRYLPDPTNDAYRYLYIGSWTVQSPLTFNQVIVFDPADNPTPLASTGTIASVVGSTNWRQKFFRSSDTNSVYYNPDIRYQPWPTAAGGRMAQYAVTAARNDPMAAGTTVNLTNVRNVTGTWCFSGAATNCAYANVSYDPGVYYRLKRNATDTDYLNPTDPASYTEYSINAAVGTTFFKGPNRSDCAGATCTRDEERQNFANWYTYYRSRNLLARGAAGEAYLSAGNTFRLGWAQINSPSTSIDGVNTTVLRAGVRDFDAATKASFYTWLYGLQTMGGGSTPLPQAIDSVGVYYQRTDVRGPWTDNPGQTGNTVANNKTCRRAYNILMTDGQWDGTLSSAGNADNTAGPTVTGPNGKTYTYTPARPYSDSNSNMLADVAMKYWKTDLQPAMTNKVEPTAEDPAFWQHMVNFTVGLGMRGTLDPDKDLPALTSGAKNWNAGNKVDDLWHAALNSRGAYISAKDPAELATALSDAVGKAMSRELREGGVSVASTSLKEGNRAYAPLYRSGDWVGDVQAFSLDAQGQLGAAVWSASGKMPVAAERNIVTWRRDADTGTLFTWANLGSNNQTALLSGLSSPTSTSGTINGMTVAGEDFLKFLRGERGLEGMADETTQPFRKRAGVLGDIVNSQPLLVAGLLDMGYASLPAGQGGGVAYSNFLKAKALRQGLLFVGANDGMLHAFRATQGASADDGKEVFAYVPRAVYPNLAKLADKTYGSTSGIYHQYYVDGPLTETDAYVPAPDAGVASWRNYVLGTLGAGGRAVYALDVTDTTAPGVSSLRWELSSADDADMGYITAPVQAGVLPNGQWVAVFGNGRFSSGGRSVLFVVNLSTGRSQTLVADSGGNNGMGGVTLVKNSSGQITTIYAGDFQGQLWRFDYDASESSYFRIANDAPLFVARDASGNAQPIMQAPLALGSSRGGSMVVFGTGALDTQADADSTAMQSIYGVWDKGLGLETLPLPFDRSALAARTMSAVAGGNGTTFYSVTGNEVNWTTQRGWVLDLTLTGLRVLYPPVTATSKDVALVSAVAPARNVQVCETGVGMGVNFLFLPDLGMNGAQSMFDTNGDGVVDANDAPVSGYETPADGADSIVKGGMGSSASDTGDMSKDMCPPGTRLLTLLGASGPVLACAPDDDPSTKRRIRDRAWRRIINPPIR